MICGKIIFASRSDAKAHIEGHHRDKRKTKSKRLSHTYYCEGCKGWHVSSKSTRVLDKYKYEVVSETSHRKPKKQQYLIIRNYR